MDIPRSTGGLFVFAIPLVPERRAKDWQRVKDNLQATLISALNQDDPNIFILLASENPLDLPELGDSRVLTIVPPVSMRMDFSPDDYDLSNQDAGRKRGLMLEETRRRGAAYLMFLDADDLVSRRLVTTVKRAQPAPGYVIRRGLVMDGATGRVVPCPGPHVRVDGFDSYCGSSIVFSLGQHAGLQDKWPEDYHQVGHNKLRELMLKSDGPLHDLEEDVLAVYVINSGQNLSNLPTNDQHRLQFSVNVAAKVAANGRPLSPAELQEFGLIA